MRGASGSPPLSWASLLPSGAGMNSTSVQVRCRSMNSAASAWEIVIKTGTGRLELRGEPDRFVREQRDAAPEVGELGAFAVVQCRAVGAELIVEVMDDRVVLLADVTVLLLLPPPAKTKHHYISPALHTPSLPLRANQSPTQRR